MESISKEFLDSKFKDYYMENRRTATHIFMFSKEQQDIRDSLCDSLYDLNCMRNTINGKVYSEMISRDFGGKYSNWPDAIYVAVGVLGDVNK